MPESNWIFLFLKFFYFFIALVDDGRSLPDRLHQVHDFWFKLRIKRRCTLDTLWTCVYLRPQSNTKTLFVPFFPFFCLRPSLICLAVASLFGRIASTYFLHVKRTMVNQNGISFGGFDCFRCSLFAFFPSSFHPVFFRCGNQIS